VAVAWSGRAPASGGDETAAARPRSRGLRRGSRRGSTMHDPGSSREVYGRSRKVWSAASANGAVSSPVAVAMALRGKDGGSGWRGGGGDSTTFYTRGSG
jgi:hypothetical protein